MAKIAIVSDVHLGTKQFGLQERYEDFFRAFENFGHSVVDHHVDAVVIGGDLFDSPRPDAYSVLRSREVIEFVNPTPVFGIDGNHDLSGCGWLRVIGATALMDMVVVPIAGVRVVGINYCNGHDLVAAIRQMADCGVKADILVAHFALAEMNGTGTADSSVIELSPLFDRLGVRAVLMGHVHIADCRKWNGVLYVNPGSSEMKSFNEPHDKYYYILDTDTWEAEKVPIKTREARTVEIVDEMALHEFHCDLIKEAQSAAYDLRYDRPFYHVMADGAIDDVFSRLSQIVYATGAIAKIVMQSSSPKGLGNAIQHKESETPLESAIEARFSKDSPEAHLVKSMLQSPDPSAIHLIVDKFMSGNPCRDIPRKNSL